MVSFVHMNPARYVISLRTVRMPRRQTPPGRLFSFSVAARLDSIGARLRSRLNQPVAWPVISGVDSDATRYFITFGAVRVPRRQTPPGRLLSLRMAARLDSIGARLRSRFDQPIARPVIACVDGDPT